MYFVSVPAWVLALWLSCPVPAITKIVIDRVPLLYTPTEGPAAAEAISMAGYRFELNKEKTRARVVVNYSYRDEMLLPRRGRHLPSSSAQIPGLKYDRSAQQIIYEANGKNTVCATVEETKHHYFRAQEPQVKNTGACVVEAVTATHLQDDGWTNRQANTLDTYFVVH